MVAASGLGLTTVSPTPQPLLPDGLNPNEVGDGCIWVGSGADGEKMSYNG